MDDTRSESGEICGRYKPYNYQTEDAAYNCVRWIRVSEVLSNPASADTGQWKTKWVRHLSTPRKFDNDFPAPIYGEQVLYTFGDSKWRTVVRIVLEDDVVTERGETYRTSVVRTDFSFYFVLRLDFISLCRTINLLIPVY